MVLYRVTTARAGCLIGVLTEVIGRSRRVGRDVHCLSVEFYLWKRGVRVTVAAPRRHLTPPMAIAHHRRVVASLTLTKSNRLPALSIKKYKRRSLTTLTKEGDQTKFVSLLLFS